MTGKVFRIITIAVFVFTGLGIGALALFPVPWTVKKDREYREARIIIPQALTQDSGEEDNPAERLARQEGMSSKAALGDGEVLVAVLNEDFDGDHLEEQFVAYRNLLEVESPIYLSYIEYDESARRYSRIWSAPTAATRPGTVTLYSQDLIGDRSVCVLLAGMNGLGEHTLTIFRKTPSPPLSPSGENTGFNKIAEFRIDGSITVRETGRPQAYLMGMTKGQSFTIAAHGRDYDSSNIMDQVEISYAYNEVNGLYEQKSINRIPGAQIEQRRLRELLGNPKAFEEFISGLWYYISPEGTVDSRQYIYFDSGSRELIFYEDETQQVFTWQNSSATRYGIYIASQNISVTTLRRTIDIELESLDSIRVRVFEDVRLKITVDPPWNGSYRKVGPLNTGSFGTGRGTTAHINAVYDGSIGKIRFFPDGSYELQVGGTVKEGKYAFFSLDDRELLELRSTELRATEPRSAPGSRETYLVEAGESPAGDDSPRRALTLLRVRLGARGVQELHEGSISLTLAVN